MFQPDAGFDETLNGAPYLALVDDDATSWAYIPGDGTLGSSLVGERLPRRVRPGLRRSRRAARPIASHAKHRDRRARASTGRSAAVARVLGDDAARDHRHRHARRRAGGRRARPRASTRAARTSRARRPTPTGAFTLHVPRGANVHLDAFQRGDAVGSAERRRRHDRRRSTLPATGAIHVVATENGSAVPVRVQVLPGAADAPDGARQLRRGRRSRGGRAARRVPGRPATSRCRRRPARGR